MSYTNGLDNPELYFQCKLYTGNGSTQSITLDGSEDMAPDLVWMKQRNAAQSHVLIDSVRGVLKRLRSDQSDAEDTKANSLTAFGTDGFTLGSAYEVNDSSDTYVAWCWKESATAGFDIVSYTGTGSTKTESHSLSAVPQLIITKSRSAAEDFGMYHHSLGNTRNISLNKITAQYSANSAFWNNTTPTSSVFTVGSHPTINYNTKTMIAYCFAEKQGFSKFGSYTGNGNADGTFIYTGFKPAFILLKDYTSGSGYNWVLLDNKRDPSNGLDKRLQASSNLAEYTDVSNFCDFTSNGFKWTGSHANWNGSGVGYIYMAFAEAPFVNSNGVPCNAR